MITSMQLPAQAQSTSVRIITRTPQDEGGIELHPNSTASSKLQMCIQYLFKYIHILTYIPLECVYCSMVSHSFFNIHL